MKGLLITIVFVIFIINYSKSQVEIPISADGVVKYSFDYSVKDSKFCISTLFSLDNQSEYSILLQKCATISSLMSWNEGISNNISVYSVILPGCKKNYIKCEDTIVLSPGSSSFSFSNNITSYPSLSNSKAIEQPNIPAPTIAILFIAIFFLLFFGVFVLVYYYFYFGIFVFLLCLFFYFYFFINFYLILEYNFIIFFFVCFFCVFFFLFYVFVYILGYS